MSACRPIQVSRPLVRPRKACRSRFEDPRRIIEAPVLVRPPADLPRRALGVTALGETRRQLPKRGVRLRVIVVTDVVAGQVVEHFLGPRAVGKRRDELVREPHVVVAIAQLANRRQIEESRFGHARAIFQIRRERVRSRAMTTQVVIALGEPEPHELAVVVFGERLQRIVDPARVRVATRREEALGAPELQLESIRGHAAAERRAQSAQLALSDRCLIGQRELVHHAQQGVDGEIAVACRFGASRQAHAHHFGRERPTCHELLVDLHGCTVIGLRLRRLGLADERPVREIARNRLRPQRLEESPRLGGLREPEASRRRVVGGIRARGRSSQATMTRPAAARSSSCRP